MTLRPLFATAALVLPFFLAWSAAAPSAPVPVFVPPPGYQLATPDPSQNQKKEVKFEPLATLPAASSEDLSISARPAGQSPTPEAAAQNAVMAYVMLFKNMPKAPVSSKVCGQDASTVSGGGAFGKQQLAMTQQFMISNGVLYTLSYTRTPNLPDDKAAQTWMHSFCPGGLAALDAVAAPVGWRSKAPLTSPTQRLGTWRSASASIVMLVEAPIAESLETTGNRAYQFFGGSDSSVLTISSKRETTLCGNEALFLAGSLDLTFMRANMVMALTQNQQHRYIALYAHPSTEADDPAALASLQTLCADGTPLPAAK